MNLDNLGADDPFRQRVRSWLAENMPAEPVPHGDRRAERDFDGAWLRRQYEAGWAGISWPREFGGRDLSADEQLIWYEEYGRAGAPSIRTRFVAMYNAGPTIIINGDDAQRARYLPRILNGDDVWCQGFSEPNAGSDLAGIRTHGVVSGDALVVNGQKTWTSYADIADYGELLVRTDPLAPRHAGLSWVICDMRTPGIEVRPIMTMDGVRHFCEVFYTDVAIPLSNVVGGLNNGWNVAMSTLVSERGTGSIGELPMLLRMLDRLTAQARGRADRNGEAFGDTSFYERIAKIRAHAHGLRAMSYMNVSRRRAAAKPGSHGSMIRLRWGELYQEACRLAMEVCGVDGIAAPSFDLAGDFEWTSRYLYSPSRTITSGTKDIQRNIIAERVLGLPTGREKREARR